MCAGWTDPCPAFNLVQDSTRTPFKIVKIDHRISGNLIRVDIYNLIKRTFLIFTSKQKKKKKEGDGCCNGNSFIRSLFINTTIIY